MRKYLFPVPKDMVDIRPAPFHKTHESMRHCIDFALPIGTPIRAIADGVVIERESRFSKTHRNRNHKFSAKTNYLTIRHNNGHVSLYLHLRWRSVKVKVGEKIRRGQIIGLSGNTGYTTYPHLHFGLYENGKNIPVKFTG